MAAALTGAWGSAHNDAALLPTSLRDAVEEAARSHEPLVIEREDASSLYLVPMSEEEALKRPHSAAADQSGLLARQGAGIARLVELARQFGQTDKARERAAGGPTRDWSREELWDRNANR